LPQLPFVTSELVRRLERTVDAFGVAWLEGHVGGPAGVRLERLGAVTAAVTPSRPELDFMNRIHGLPADPGRLDDVLAVYREAGVRPWIEVPPGSEELLARLVDAGARPLEPVAVLYTTAERRAVPAAPELRVVGADEALRFAHLHLEGHGVPADARASDAPAVAAAIARRDVRGYIASVDGEDAAAGVLFLHDGDASAANASTLERFRGRGCQTALLARRLTDAADAGAELFSSLTILGSPSQRNMERAGLRVAYTKTVWRL
jgi:ribosomal protein S18 acetylase RimI-like enzyme